MLVDYKYYIEDFGGEKISTESDFKRTINLAETHLCNFTFNRIKNDVENEHLIKSCICEMCDAIYDMTLKDNGKVKKSDNSTVNDGKIVKSENTDGYSVSYVTERIDGQDAEKALENKLYRIAKVYLGNTGLLYRGVC